MDRGPWFAPYAHPAEWIYARLLDSVRIAYSYESETLAIVWGDNGEPLEFFSPDFFLPDVRAPRPDGTRYEGRFVEITTCRRKLVTKKHRKLRRARNLYPQYEFQIVYRQDIYDICEELGFAYEMALLPDQVERYRDEIEERRANAGQ